MIQVVSFLAKLFGFIVKAGVVAAGVFVFTKTSNIYYALGTAWLLNYIRCLFIEVVKKAQKDPGDNIFTAEDAVKLAFRPLNNAIDYLIHTYVKAERANKA